jgi:SRSO17 transposase
MDGTQSPKDISTRLQKIATTASWRPKLALTTLAHHMDEATQGRPERRAALEEYVIGLLLDGERKSAAPMAARLAAL